MADPAEIEEVVAAVPLFARLSPRQRARLAAKATTRSYPAGSIVVRQGDTSMSFYVVLGGHVRIDHEAEGDSVQVDEARRGGFFGELGLIGDQPRAATVTAVEDTDREDERADPGADAELDRYGHGVEQRASDAERHRDADDETFEHDDAHRALP